MGKRSSGILMHITSLPSRYGIGDLGPDAYNFADFLASTKQSFWQILPLNPTDPAHGNSPYSSISAFAANPLLISLDKMVEDGYLAKDDVKQIPEFPADRVDYGAVVDYKFRVLEAAFRRFRDKKKRDAGYEKFCRENACWIDDFALFVALKGEFGGKVWSEWPDDYKYRNPGALDYARDHFQDSITRAKFLQFVFAQQWDALKGYCNGKGIQLIGDLPIYVNYDSADVWANSWLFKLNDQKWPYAVSGVPPDYFSATGQRWGNPVYNWPVLKDSGFQWWVQRLARTFKLYNIVRIDHFRGLVAYWEIPAHEQTAINGHWEQVPAEDFFNMLLRHFAQLPLIAEDLGLITPDVREVLRTFNLAGMKVLTFAFGEENPRHIYLPHMYEENYVVYTGTHDTNTVRGWFETEATPEHKRRLFRYLGREVHADNVHRELMRLAMMSKAYLALFPMQDVLGLGDYARMNRPASANGNWQWRLTPAQLTPEVGALLSELTYVYGRV
jgi:4-alpha-glucanotransferase